MSYEEARAKFVEYRDRRDRICKMSDWLYKKVCTEYMDHPDVYDEENLKALHALESAIIKFQIEMDSPTLYNSFTEEEKIELGWR